MSSLEREHAVIPESDLVFLPQVMLRGERIAVLELDGRTCQWSVEVEAETLRVVTQFSRLVHPCVRRCFGMTLTKSLPIVVAVEAWQCSLLEFMEKTPVDELTLRVRLGILAQVASGMRFLHAHGVTNCALCTETVLIAGDGRALVEGFSEERVGWVFNRSGRLAIGHHFFVAPELLNCRDGKGTRTADVFSFGSLIVAVMDRGHPYESLRDQNFMAVVMRILSGNLSPTPPDKCNNEIADLVRSTTARDPQLRPTFAEIEWRMQREAKFALCDIALRCTEILFALQDLELPAFLLLKIINAAVPNTVQRPLKWRMIEFAVSVAFQHFPFFRSLFAPFITYHLSHQGEALSTAEQE
jgi:hypothetical protein